MELCLGFEDWVVLPSSHEVCVGKGFVHFSTFHGIQDFFTPDPGHIVILFIQNIKKHKQFVLIWWAIPKDLRMQEGKIKFTFLFCFGGGQTLVHRFYFIPLFALSYLDLVVLFFPDFLGLFFNIYCAVYCPNLFDPWAGYFVVVKLHILAPEQQLLFGNEGPSQYLGRNSLSFYFLELLRVTVKENKLNLPRVFFLSHKIKPFFGWSFASWRTNDCFGIKA